MHLIFLNPPFPEYLASGIPFPPDAMSRTSFLENNRLSEGYKLRPQSSSDNRSCSINDGIISTPSRFRTELEMLSPRDRRKGEKDVYP